MKKTLFMLLLILVISALWSQNGTPQVLSAQISVPGNGVMDFVVIGNYGYIANDAFLIKYELSSRNILWSKPFPNFYGNGNGQGMAKVGNNLVFTYDGVVTKMSTEDDTLWQTTLPGRIAISLDSTRNRIVCYSWTGLLTVINLDNGQILSQRQMPFEGLKNTANHSAVAVSDNEFITTDNTIYGINWNSATLVSKVAIVNNITNVVWQYSMPDLTTCNIKLLNSDNFYVSVSDIGGVSNSRIFFFEDLGNNFVITDSVDAGGPINTNLVSTLTAGNNILAVGKNILGDNVGDEDGRQAIFVIYDNQGQVRTSQVNTQTDFTTYQGLAESNGRVYTVLLTQTYIGGPKTFYLTELTDIYNSAVGIDNPDTPATPQLSLTCYPTPSRVGNNVNVKFEAKSRDNVTIEVYNIKGQKVRTLVNQSFSSGQHQTVWNGRTDSNQPVSSGMYFFRMRSGTFSATRKVILMK